MRTKAYYALINNEERLTIPIVKALPGGFEVDGSLWTEYCHPLPMRLSITAAQVEGLLKRQTAANATPAWFQDPPKGRSYGVSYPGVVLELGEAAKYGLHTAKRADPDGVIHQGEVAFTWEAIAVYHLLQAGKWSFQERSPIPTLEEGFACLKAGLDITL